MFPTDKKLGYDYAKKKEISNATFTGY